MKKVSYINEKLSNRADVVLSDVDLVRDLFNEMLFSHETKCWEKVLVIGMRPAGSGGYEYALRTNKLCVSDQNWLIDMAKQLLWKDV